MSGERRAAASPGEEVLPALPQPLRFLGIVSVRCDLGVDLLGELGVVRERRLDLLRAQAEQIDGPPDPFSGGDVAADDPPHHLPDVGTSHKPSSSPRRPITKADKGVPTNAETIVDQFLSDGGGRLASSHRLSLEPFRHPWTTEANRYWMSHD